MLFNLKFFISLTLIFLLIISLVLITLDWFAMQGLKANEMTDAANAAVEYKNLAKAVNYQFKTIGSDISKHVSDTKLYKMLPAVFNTVGVLIAMYLVYTG